MLSGSSILTALRGRGLRVDAKRGGRHGAGGDCQRAQRLAGERLVALQQVRASVVGQRNGLAVLPDIAALRRAGFGRTLDENVQLARLVAIEMDGGMALAFGGEGDFRNARIPLQLRFGHAELARRHDQRAFGRVALHRPAPLAVHERGVVGERCGAQRPLDARRAATTSASIALPSIVKSPSGM